MDAWERCVNEARVALIKTYQKYKDPHYALGEEKDKTGAMSRFKLAKLMFLLNSGKASRWASGSPWGSGDVA